MPVHWGSWNGPPHREMVGSVSERWKRWSQKNQTLHFDDGIMQIDRHPRRGDFLLMEGERWWVIMWCCQMYNTQISFGSYRFPFW